ncbi:MAG: hypothetical protein LRS46_01405 [Desulfurococcales archaeon]|nr:hypothetical protein [Desulfurococcales archaeon]
MEDCSLEEVSEAYIALGEHLAGMRSEPSGSEPPLVQAYMLECPGPFNLSVGESLGREARSTLTDLLASRGLVPVCSPLAPADSLAHALIFAGLLAAAEARGDSSASTARLRLLDEILVPIVERLEGGDYCSKLLAEALRAIVDEDFVCLGVSGGGSGGRGGDPRYKYEVHR